MREWGLVSPTELERIVVVSPHLDDAVLGCGRLMAAHPGATVVTVYAGAPDAYPDPMTRWDALAGFEPGDDVLGARKEEDRKALTELGATPRHLDFVEHQYLDREDWVGPDHTVDRLEEELRALGPTAVFIPFGIANPITSQRTTPPCECGSASQARPGSVMRTPGTSTFQASSRGG